MFQWNSQLLTESTLHRFAIISYEICSKIIFFKDTVGSFKCECNDGFYLNSNKECKSKDKCEWATTCMLSMFFIEILEYSNVNVKVLTMLY